MGLCGTIRSKKKKQKMWFIIGLPYCSDSLCGAEFRLECRCLGAKMLKTPSASCWPGAWIRVKLCCAHRWNEQNTKVVFSNMLARTSTKHSQRLWNHNRRGPKCYIAKQEEKVDSTYNVLVWHVSNKAPAWRVVECFTKQRCQFIKTLPTKTGSNFLRFALQLRLFFDIETDLKGRCCKTIVSINNLKASFQYIEWHLES